MGVVAAAEWQVYLMAAQFLVVLIGALVAWRQVMEARTLRLERNRPFVVVGFDVDFERGLMIFLEVENLGNSLARDIQIDIDPPLMSSVDVELHELKMLNEGIATLVPGKKLRTFFDSSMQRYEKRESFPLNHNATVKYVDQSGRRKFEEAFSLDLEQYENMQFIRRHGVDDVYKELSTMRKVFEKWGRRGGRGLLAVSLNESREDQERIRESIEQSRERRETT